MTDEQPQHRPSPPLIDVRVYGRPDLATIDALARLQLMARRRGGSIRLCGACPELVELLSLAGLQEVIPLVEDSERSASARLGTLAKRRSDPDE